MVRATLTLLSCSQNFPRAPFNHEKIDVSFLCVSPVIDHEFRHHIVKVAVDPRDDSRVDPQTTLTMLRRNS